MQFYNCSLREKGRRLCRHSGVVWTMGWRGKKHTCLQINWFGQEASKEELCVVKQACGEAGMSQQKHSHDHRANHDAEHIYTYFCLQLSSTHTCVPYCIVDNLC